MIKINALAYERKSSKALNENQRSKTKCKELCQIEIKIV